MRMAKTWAPHYLLMQKEFENTCFIAVLLLWLFVHVKLKQSFVINLSSWISSLFVMKQGSRGNNLPIHTYAFSMKYMTVYQVMFTNAHSCISIVTILPVIVVAFIDKLD